MNIRNRFRDLRGFTLVELLTVLAMVGIFMAAAYGVYINNQRTAYSQQEVSEVQQNLRVGMDQLSRDLLMAGLLAKSETPVTGTNSSLTIFMASTTPRSARIVEALDDNVRDITVPTDVAGTDLFLFPVSSYEERNLFAAGDIVRIIAPQDGNDPYLANVNDAAHPEYSLLEVDGVDSMTTSTLPDGTKVPAVRLKLGPDAVAPSLPITYAPGNLIVHSSATAPFPNTIAYNLNADGELVRTTNGITNNVVAEKLAAIAVEYLLDDGSVVTAPTSDDYKSVRAVRVTLTGQTEQTNLTNGVPKVRQLVATCGIRNRGADKGR